MTAVDKVEALLFVATDPAPVETLARALNLTEGQIEAAIDVLETRLQERGALQIVKLAGGYQISTKPEYAEHIAAFLQPQKNKLGRSLLEVLAIVAYNQPMTTAEIERVRGVQSDYGVRSLVDRGLIREVGRKQAPGRPVLYGTTETFLHHFKLNDLSQLPPVNPAAQSDGGVAVVTL